MTRTLPLLFAAALAVTGCTDDPHGTRPPSPSGTTTAAPAKTSGTTEPSEEAEIQANLAKLSPEDRAEAEKQKFCAIETENRLGSMGVPIKVVVKGEPVFVCCKGCKSDVEKNPDKTLAKVKEMKEKNAKK